MITATLAAAATASMFAIVTEEQLALRAAPIDSAPQQAVLLAGDSLEIRGEHGDFLKVYDHRHERAGYVKAPSVRVQSLAPADAPELLAVVRFLRDTRGGEAVGIAYGAAYLKAAPAEAITGEVFSALGNMAERLAERASAPQSPRSGPAIAAQLEVAAGYGVHMLSFERDGKIQLCYDGEAFRRVLAMPATDEQKAQAALALTRHDCIPPGLPPVQRFDHDNWRADILDRVDTTTIRDQTRNRILMRQAGVWAGLAYQRARRPELGTAAVHQAGTRALQALARVENNELTGPDAVTYNNAAIRVGASRWATEAVATTAQKPAILSVLTSPGQPGETCVHLVDAKHDAEHALLTRCTYGVVWAASATANAQNTALALAVQPLDTWREMWVFRQDKEGWHVDVLPPAEDNPGLGYIEFAGWVPGGGQMLSARETRIDGQYRKRFEARSMTTLAVDRQADKPGNLSVFYRWQSPVWKAGTVSVR
jgi:hypothetical protein